MDTPDQRSALSSPTNCGVCHIHSCALFLFQLPGVAFALDEVLLTTFIRVQQIQAEISRFSRSALQIQSLARRKQSTQARTRRSRYQTYVSIVASHMLPSAVAQMRGIYLPSLPSKSVRFEVAAPVVVSPALTSIRHAARLHRHEEEHLLNVST